MNASDYKFDRIVVEVETETEIRIIRFEGQWLVSNEGYYGGYWAALTKEGKIAVFLAYGSDESKRSDITLFAACEPYNLLWYEIHENFKEFALAVVDGGAPRYPESLISSVAEELGISYEQPPPRRTLLM